MVVNDDGTATYALEDSEDSVFLVCRSEPYQGYWPKEWYPDEESATAALEEKDDVYWAVVEVERGD